MKMFFFTRFLKQGPLSTDDKKLKTDLEERVKLLKEMAEAYKDVGECFPSLRTAHPPCWRS